MAWEEAGRGWGARAAEWAYLFEPYARSANERVFELLGVGTGTRLVDIACGSGLAANLARHRGAEVTGIDAAEALIAIARARTPDGDFRVGDMFSLPFEDESFEVATSFNGIWKGCETAVCETHRVLVARSRFGMTFWGSFERLGLMPYFLKSSSIRPPATAPPVSSRVTPVVREWSRRCWHRPASGSSNGVRSTWSTSGQTSRRQFAPWPLPARRSRRSRPSGTTPSVLPCPKCWPRCAMTTLACRSRPSSAGSRPRSPEHTDRSTP